MSSIIFSIFFFFHSFFSNKQKSKMRKNIKTETREGNCQSTSPSHKRRQNLIHHILLPDQFIYNNKDERRSDIEKQSIFVVPILATNMFYFIIQFYINCIYTKL